MGLFDILKSAKDAVKQVATDVKQGTFIKNFSEAGEQAGSEAFDAMQAGEDKGITKNIQGTVLDLASGGANIQNQIDTYKQSGNRNFVADALAGVAQAPATISSGVGGVFDGDKTVTQRVDSATKAGLGVVSLLPGAAGWNVAYETLVPTSAKKSVQDAVMNLQGDVSSIGQKMGFSKADSDAAASIMQNALGIAAGILGPKIGKGVETKVAGVRVPTPLSKIVSKSAGLTTNAIIQASPDLIPLAYDFLTTHKDTPDLGGKAAMISLATQFAGLVPVKGLKTRLKSEINGEQTKMTIDEPTTPKADINETAPIVDKLPEDVNTPAKTTTKKAKAEKKSGFDVNSFIQSFSLPAELTKAKPGFAYGAKKFVVDYGNPFFTALHIIRDNKKGDRSKSDAKYLKVVMDATGLDEGSARKLGDVVHADIKKKIESNDYSSDGVVSVDQNIFGKKVDAPTPPIVEAPVTPKTESTPPVFDPIKIETNNIPDPIVTPDTPLTSDMPTPEPVVDAGLSGTVKKARQKKVKADTVVPEGTPITPNTEVPPTTKPPKVKAPRTDLATKLDNIKNSLSLKDVFVSKSKNALNSVGTIGGYLEKGLSNIVGKTINLRNITQSARDSRNLFANAILDFVGVDKRKATFTRKIDIKPEDVEGGITPNESQKILSIEEVQKVIDNIIPNSIKNFIGDKKVIADMENQAKAEYLYEINKENPDKINALFTPEEQKMLQDSEIKRDQASGELAQYLMDQGLLQERDLADTYVRYVVSEWGRDKMKLNDPINIEIAGKTYQFDSIEQALTSIMARRDKGDKHISATMEKALASILKAKSEGIDKFRVHSPTMQLLSYSMEIGKLLQNKTVLDNFRQFMTKDKNGLNTEEAKFIQGLFPEHGPSEKLENIIGINRKDTDIAGKVMNAAADVTRMTSTAILAGRLGTFFQPVFSSMPKGAIVYINKAFGGNAASPIGINDIRVSEVLSANGFTPDYQVFDTSPSGQFMKGAHKAAQISSGTPLETPPKKLVALSSMREVLNKNKIKTSSDPLEIVTKWEEWARNPKNKDAYQIAQDRIQETIDWMGGSTIFNKSMIDIARKTNFQALTGYINGQVNKGMTDIGRVLGAIETGELQKGDAAKRLTGTFAVWGLVAAGAYGYLKYQNPEADDEALTDMAIQYANRQSGNPLQGLYSVSSSVASSPLSAGVGLSKDALELGWAIATGNEGVQVKAEKLAENIIKLQGGLNTINTLSDGALSQASADALGTVNTRDMTAAGNARGISDSGIAAAAFNMKPEQMVQDFIYGKLTDADLRNSIKIANPTLKEAAVVTTGLAKDWVKNVIKPVSDFVNGFGEDKVDYGRMQAMYDVYKKIKVEDTLPSVLGKLGVTDPYLQNLVANEIQQLNMTAKGSGDGGNILGSKVTETPGQQSLIIGNFGAEMDRIEEENPYVYNQIIAGLTSISMENTRREGGLVNDRNSMATIKNLMSTSTPKDDAVIAAISQNNPNSTALAQSIWNTYQKIIGTNPSLDDTKKSIAFLNDIMKQVYTAGPWTEGLERSVALKSFESLSGLLETAKQNGWQTVTQIISGAPFLEQAIQAGLKYRGWIQSPSNTSTIGADGNPTGPTTNLPLPTTDMTDGAAMKAAKFQVSKAGGSGVKAVDRKVRSLSEIIGQSRNQQPLNVR